MHEELDTFEVLKALIPFKELNWEALDELAPQVEIREYPEGTYVFRRGSASLGLLFIVLDGLAEVTLNNDRGVETVVGYRRRSDMFGETVVLTGGNYSGNVRVKEALTCLVIPREVFENLIHNHSEVATFFSRVMLDRMRMLYDEIVSEQSLDTFSRAESSLFKRHVGEIMSRPAITCRPEDSITGVAGLMAEHNISSVVVIDDVGQPLGLVTERDLVSQMFAEGLSPSDRRAGDVLNTNLVTLPSDAFLSEALLAVIKSGAKHVTVTESNLLVGIVSLVDLLKAQSTGSLWVAHRIESANSLASLRETGKEVDNFLYALVTEKAPTRELMEIMAALNDKLTRRVVHLCEEQMVEDGLGAAPVPYCFVNMGSAARREQTLRTDQDNAVIYADPEPDQAESVRRYFLTLGERIVESLAECGFQKCKGNVVASNPAWCRSMSEWNGALHRWIYSPEPEGIRMLTIFLDLRPMHGDKGLTSILWERIFEAFERQTVITHMLTNDEVQLRVPLTMLGGFITEKSGPHKNELNLKSGVCIHIVNCIRVFAMRYKITEPSTFGRLEQLVKRGAISRDDAEFIQASFETVMMFRIRENVIKHRQGLAADNYIKPQTLSKREQAVLKDALSVISRLQKLTSSNFTEVWLNYLKPGS
ncbi:MAG: DUF294 nucleotidyltransferase-like domain-containing protein [Eubacteriales bacterium]|nr:CBS domain-containing protein [Bacillota bacterium]MBV1727365.1 CBS domain-containing protein [Desulforudis sp.]MDZ4043486.1 DUF294 nucleotidyltransferase-like domain-containing protein [Eubacteriales bacterium]MBU4533496.1 CBS domain-containing protein [Bacillota bacterium]MBU4554868.1 CBS domain-containing protein [Bacillota bacterium]